MTIHSKLCSTALSLLAVFTLAPVADAQNMIGWRYDGYNVPGDALVPTDLAGAPLFEQLNWNNHVSTSQGPSSPVPFALADNTGASTGMSLTTFTLSINNSWHHDQYATPNEKLMNSFADKQPSLTFSNIPASFQLSGYSVIVYYGNNEPTRTSTLSLTGSADDFFSRQIQTGNTALSGVRAVGFVQETGALSGPSNYTVFTGLNDSQLTVALTNDNNNGISAVQFVAVPEPTSVGLLALGAGALGLRRRR